MAKHLTLFAAAGLVALPLAAFAFNCPNEIKAIDAKLATKPPISKETVDKVAKLRDKAVTAHAADKHSDAMSAISEAKKLLGM